MDERETNHKLQKRSSNGSTEDDTSLQVEQSLLSDNGTPDTDEVSSSTTSDEVQGDRNHSATQNHNDAAVFPQKRAPKEGITKAVAAEQARKKRLAIIESEMRALAPHTGQGNHAITLRLLNLEEEMLRIHQEQGTLHTDRNPFTNIKIGKLVFSVISDGKVPVAIGEEVASYLEEDGYHENAARVRAVTQRAIENGDEFYKPEHAEDH
ncbi:hypothetical protein JT359_20070 [Candidatus Poribacteria bacterium]|nr:hypothetical protein [Candidatus Poribacteria bacterium]